MAYNKPQCQSFHLNSKKSTAKEQHRKVKGSAVLTRKTLGFWNVAPRTAEQTTAHTPSTAVTIGVTGFATLPMGTVVLGPEVRGLGVGVETGKEPLPSWIVELASRVHSQYGVLCASILAHPGGQSHRPSSHCPTYYLQVRGLLGTPLFLMHSAKGVNMVVAPPTVSLRVLPTQCQRHWNKRVTWW